jgi:cell division protein FtsX
MTIRHLWKGVWQLLAGFALLILGLSVVSTGVTMIASASVTTALTVGQDLRRFWRTTYDILVRPPASRSEIEQKYGLVEANHLSGIWGGITFEQYESIRSIPGVEVAAPIAMLGYLGELVPTGPLANIETGGVFILKERVEVDTGAFLDEAERSTFYYVGSETPDDSIANLIVLPPGMPITDLFEIPLLLAGIDSFQEAELLALDQAIAKGHYFNNPVPTTQLQNSLSPGPGGSNKIPVLVSSRSYIRLSLAAELKRLPLEVNEHSLEMIAKQGGISYLSSLEEKAETLGALNIEGDQVHSLLVDSLLGASGSNRRTIHSLTWAIPSRITYREIDPPLDYDGLVLEIVPATQGPSTHGWEWRWIPYRNTFPAHLRGIFWLYAVGSFDVEQIPISSSINPVPLETYLPPVSQLRYTENGGVVDPPISLLPTLNPAGYIQGPPMLLTTIGFARAILGEDVISAIRVRVALEGCPGDYLTCPLTPQNQRKIETIASEIARRTGLEVDIMVGSSPTRVLVHVPGIGYVEEQWIQKNVSVTYTEKVQTGHLLLLGALLGIGGLFTLDLAWAEVVARRRTIALQKALGWRSSTIFRQVLGQIAGVGSVASLLGVLLAWGVSLLLGWEPPLPGLLIGVPLLVVGLSLVGGLYPAWLAARLAPVAGLSRGNVRYPRRKTHHMPARSLLPYAWQGLARRWSRTALGALTAALSAALLVLMLAITVDRQGAMSGTLLGEFILVQIEGYHYAIVGIGFGLAALSLANSLLAGVLERRREIGVLKAVGWRTSAVARLFLVEGALIGALGGLAGAVLGLAVFVGLYETVSPSLGWIGAVGVGLPVEVGLLAALYPARVAANVPPAEAVRYE